MTCHLIEHPEDSGMHSSSAGYASAFARAGTHHWIENVSSRMLLAQCEGHDLPVTVDNGGYGLSYVANPHSAYALYARREIELVKMRRGRSIALGSITLLDGLLRWAGIAKIVHIDNWLLSTNLHGAWQGEGLTALRNLLVRRFPEHFLALRSLDAWSSPDLLKQVRADGWLLLPARQIWVVDDLARQWRNHNNAANDRRALARSGLSIEKPKTLLPTDAARIADLYRQLYVQKYSTLNPIFTSNFVSLTQHNGLMDYRLAQNSRGEIMAVAGMLVRDGIMTPSVVGYDTSRSPREALYRIAYYLFCEAAEEAGWRLHASAGAADFKRARGAHGVIEYMAIHASHLAAPQRAVIHALASILERWIVPMMQREGW